MKSREDVIKGLECCLADEARDTKCWEDGDYPDCPYNDHVDGCMGRLDRDALALLKAQEPVKPIERLCYLFADRYCDAVSPRMVACGACGEWLPTGDATTKYCPHCGRPVKWK